MPSASSLIASARSQGYSDNTISGMLGYCGRNGTRDINAVLDGRAINCSGRVSALENKLGRSSNHYHTSTATTSSSRSSYHPSTSYAQQPAASTYQYQQKTPAWTKKPLSKRQVIQKQQTPVTWQQPPTTQELEQLRLEIEGLKSELASRDQIISAKDSFLAQTQQDLNNVNFHYAQSRNTIDTKQRIIDDKEQIIGQQKQTIEQQRGTITQQQEKIIELEAANQRALEQLTLFADQHQKQEEEVKVEVEVKKEEEEEMKEEMQFKQEPQEDGVHHEDNKTRAARAKKEQPRMIDDDDNDDDNQQPENKATPLSSSAPPPISSSSTVTSSGGWRQTSRFNANILQASTLTMIETISATFIADKEKAQKRALEDHRIELVKIKSEVFAKMEKSLDKQKYLDCFYPSHFSTFGPDTRSARVVVNSADEQQQEEAAVAGRK